MLGNKTLLTASNLNNAYVSLTNTNAQSMNSSLTLSGGALTLKNSTITDNSSSSYMKISPQGNNVILYNGVNNQRLDVYSSSGSESTYIQTINGTKSFGQIDVSSPIDHLEINTNSKKTVLFGGNIEASGGIIQADNPLNTQANVYLGWLNNDPRIRIGGSGTGSAGTFRVQGIGDADRFTIDAVGNTWTSGNSTVSGKLTASGGVGISNTNPLSFDTYGGGIYMGDTTWIRTWGGKSFYHDSGNFRTDGTLQVGNGGGTLSVPNNGTFNYNSGKFTISTGGAINTVGPFIMSTSKNQSTGINLDGVKIDTVFNGGDVAITSLNQLRFGTGNAWDWNQWAGIKYDPSATALYIGGPASAHFTSNASPPNIDVVFDGLKSFNVDGETYIRNQHYLTFSGGGINLNMPNSNGYWANGIFFNDVTNANSYGGLGLYGHSSNAQYAYFGYGASPWSSLGIYITPNGYVGIGKTSPSYNLDVSGNMNVTGIIYSLGDNQASFQVGNDVQLWDINVPNTMGVYGVENSSVGAIKLGSTGPTLYGSGNFLGLGTTSPAYPLDIVGNIRIASGNNITSSYNNAFFLADHADGDISLSAVGRNLVLGLQNTSQVAINAPIYGSNNTTEIIGTDGTLYYRGTDIDTIYFKTNGSVPMSGDLNLNANRLVFNNGGTSNLDHIWFNDNTSPYGDGGSYSFVADSTGNAIGNATLYAGSLALSNQLDMQNHNIKNLSYLYGQYGTIAQSTDEWLRFNNDGSHTSGVYFGSSIVRTDGQLQIGSNGASFLVDANGNVTANNGTYNGYLSAKGFQTSNTSSGNANNWTKIGSITLTSQYSDAETYASVMGAGDGSNSSRFRFWWRVKQQSALGQAPIVELNIYDEYQVSNSNLIAVTTINTTSQTTVELYAKIPNSYEAYFVNPYQASGSITWYTGQGFLVSLPSGTQTTASYHVGTMHTSRNTLDDGSGNMTISGKFTAGGVGFGNVTSGYFGDGSNLAPRIPSSSGYFTVQNSSLANKFMVYGTGKVITSNNTLDDSNGNANFTGTITGNYIYINNDPTSSMQATTKQYVDRKASFVPMNAWYAKNPIDDYPNAMFSAMKFNSSLAGQDWGSSSDGMGAGLVITHTSRDSSSDNNTGVLYPGSVHQMLYHEGGYGLYHRYANVSRAYSGISVWSPSISPALNAMYMPTQANENGYYYKVTTTGNTGATEPLWNTTGTTNDGTVVWTVVGTIWASFDKILTGKTMNSTDVSTAVGQGLTTTSNPTFSSLTVNGNITGSATFISNSTSADVFQALGASGIKTFRWEGGNLRFWSSQVSTNEALTLASNGNVGVYQSAPSYKLDVTGDVRTTTAFRATASNTGLLYLGSNSSIWDVNTSNTMGIYGQQNTAVGGLKLGSTGPTLYGTGNMLGIGTTSPAYTLDVAGSIRIASGGAIYSGYNNQPILKDNGNSNVVINGAGGGLYLGYQNTTQNVLSSKMVASDASTNIIGTDGTLYYKGQDTDTRYVNATGDTMSSDLTFSNVNNGIGLTVVTSGSAIKTSGSWITGGNDAIGLSKINDVAIQTWYGFSVSPTIAGQNVPQGIPAFSIDARGGDAYLYRNLYLNNSNINNISYLYGQYGTIARSVDEWLRLNDDGSHTNGVYFGSSITRTDGTLQVGNNGQYFNASSTGVAIGGSTTPRNKLDIQGGGVVIGANIQNSGGFVDGTLTVGNTTYSYSGNNGGEGWGSNGDTITLQAKDYSTIAFLQANTKVDYIRGGAGTIDIGYDGGWGRSNVNFTNGIWNNSGKVGIGTTSPSQQLDVNGSIRTNNSIYSPNSYLGFLTDAGGALPIAVGSLAVTNSYSNTAPTNGIYVQGSAGVGTTQPNKKLDVNGDIAVSGNIYSSGYLDFYDLNNSTLLLRAGSLVVAGDYSKTAPSNGLYVQGNVGIGTNSPAYPLDVVGTVQSNSQFISNANGDVFQALGTGNTTKTFRYDNSNFRFWNSGSGELMTLTQNTRVGVNNPSPSYTLDVGGDIKTSTAFRAPTNNTQAFYVGTNSAIWDVNTANTMGIYGQSNTSVGALKLGSTGPTLYGSGGTLGIGTTAPWTSMALDVAGSIRISAGHGIYSGYNNNYILNDHNNGNVTLSATNSTSGNLYLGYQNTAHVYLSTNLTTTSNTNILGTDGTLYYKGQDTDARYMNATGDTISGSIYFAGNTNEGIYGDPSGWTRIDPNGQRFIMPVPQSRVNTGDLILSVEDTTNWIHHFELNANGNMKVNNLTVTGNITLNNTNINSIAYLNGQYGTIAHSRSDEWLGLNDDGSHTAGVYFGSSTTRTDGTLQVGSNGQYFNANSSGITFSAIPIVNITGNGTELLRFNTERPWSLYQVGSGAGANLALKSSTANKDFLVQNVSGNTVLDVFVGSANTDGLVTVNGDSQVNSGKQGMTGYVKVVQAVPDLTNHTSITSSGWYNIAHNPNGDRAFGKFTLLDVSLARHQIVQFTATNAYASGIVSTVHYLAHGRAGGSPFTSVRHVYNSSSGGEYWLQVWIDISDNTSNPAVVRCILEDNYWESGWQLINFTAGTVPTGYTTNSFQISDHDHKPNLYANTSAPPSQGGGIGDIYVQY